VAHEEIIFHSGTVFDGHAFLPAGTCVKVASGTISAVGPAAEMATAGGSREPAAARRASLVDLQGGTLLPGFIDAHMHRRRCGPLSSRVLKPRGEATRWVMSRTAALRLCGGLVSGG
jgi:predicted amidohydrolase YtcJ